MCWMCFWKNQRVRDDHISPVSPTVLFSYVAPFLGAVLRIFPDWVKGSFCNLIRGFGFSLKLDVVGTVTLCPNNPDQRRGNMTMV